MIFKKIFLLFILATSINTISAQETVIEYSDINVANYGDGRIFLRQQDDKKTPLDGKFRIIDGYRSVYAIATIKDGFYNGEYKEYYREKLIEECTYKEGHLNGVRKQYHSDGKTLRTNGTFVNGKMHGRYETYSISGSLESSMEMQNGKQHGAEKRYSQGELTTEKYFKNDEPDGTWIEHISSNIGDYTRRSSFVNGKRDGEYSEIFKDGRIKEKGFYKNGEAHGVWEEYRKSGIIEKSTTYENGEKIKDVTYFTNGKPEISTSYLNGKRNGERLKYSYDTGQLKEMFTFKDNKEHGPYVRYYPNGNIKEQGECYYDSAIKRTEYYENGVKKSVAECEPGSLLKVVQRWDKKGKELSDY